MKHYGDFSVLAAAILTLTNVRPAPAQNRSAARLQLDAIVDAIREGNLGTTEILQIPSEVEHPANITPLSLENTWENRLTVKLLRSSQQEKLASTLRMATVQPLDVKLDRLDVRWGIVFYAHRTPEGKRLGAIYFDRTGRKGAVNNIPVAFDPTLFVRLKAALHLSIE